MGLGLEPLAVALLTNEYLGRESALELPLAWVVGASAVAGFSISYTALKTFASSAERVDELARD